MAKLFKVGITAEGDISTTGFLKSTNSQGDEGGQIDLTKAATNTTLTTGVTIDVFQNKVRIFETGGTNRGYYLDISNGGTSVGTNLVGGGSASNSFTTIAVPSGTNPIATSSTDTLTLTAGTGITITGTAGTDSIAIATNATNINTGSTIVLRDASGDFAANQVTLVSQKFGTGAGAPSFNSYSAGVRAIYYDNIGAASAGYAVGINSGEFWHTTSDTTGSFKWYGGVTLAATLTGTGALTAASFNSITGLSSTTPSANGAAAVGTATTAARADHVHPTTGLGLTSSGLNQFAATTSAQLAGVISDETGSGALVFATSPALTTPNIGVATGTSFNSITGLSSTTPSASGTAAVGTATTAARADHVHSAFTTVSGGFGTASALTEGATPARLSVLGAASEIGLIVKANATTPGDLQQWQYSSGVIAASLDINGLFSAVSLNVIDATATTFNKMAITAPSTGSTLAIADLKTFTVNNTITLNGTDSRTYTFPTTNATLARTDAAQTFTGTQTIDVINAASSSSTTADIFGNVTTGTVGIADGLTTGTLNIGNGTTTGTGRTVNINTNASGSVTVTTNIGSAVLGSTINLVAGVSGVILTSTGLITTPATTSAASIGMTIRTGNTTTSGNSGNLTLDVGTAASTAGTVLVGTSAASAVTIGRTGTTTTMQGSTSITNATIVNGGTFAYYGYSTSAGTSTLTNVPGTVSYATSIPSLLISVLTSAATTNTGSVGAEFRASSTTTTHLITFSSSATARGSISTNGTATTYSTSSDYRLKENIRPIPDAIERLMLLKPSRFNFIEFPDRVVDGFLAHEAQEVVPESVVGDKDAINEDGSPAYQGIDQGKLVPLLTAALQDSVKEVEDLKTTVSALLSRIEALEA